MTTEIDKGIDLARVGLSKSLMTTPCERKGAYGELVRDSFGRRLRFPMPERVLFGSAVDTAVSFIAEHERRGAAWDATDALELGLARAAEMDASEDIDHAVFRVQVANALTLFATTTVGRPGLANPLAWLREHMAEPEFRIQGDDGRSLRADDIIGTPDFMCRHVIDVKTTARRYSEDKFTASAEMPIYALLYAAEHDGILPDGLHYLVYHRVTKPYWDVYSAPASADLVALGAAWAQRWRKGLGTGDAELFGFNTKFCADCGFRDAIPDVGFAGCSVGSLIPREEAA